MRDHDEHLTAQELLLAMDRELPSQRQTAAEAHLAQCVECQDRRAQIADASESVTALYHATAAPHSADTSPDRARLRSSLRAIAEQPHPSSAVRILSNFAPASRWAIAGAAALVAVLLTRALYPPQPLEPAIVNAPAEIDALPVASLTPGATSNLSAAELCSRGALEPRAIPETVRERVLRNYGMTDVPYNEYELDYLITPELGGAPDARNLWPQRYASRRWNAHIKDQLEELLPRLVCDRQVALETAQRDIARDWILAYKKYFHSDVPLRAQADFHAEEAVPSAPTLKLIAFSSAP